MVLHCRYNEYFCCVELIRRLLAAIWKIWFAFFFIITFLVMYPFFLLFLQNQKWIPVVMTLKRWWGGFSIFIAGIFMKRIYRTDRNKLPSNCIVVANHSSYLDIIMTVHVVPFNVIFMGKSELLKVPLFNVFFKKLDIPVNRKSATAAHQSLVRCGQELDKGRAVVIFPEGTISNEGKLKAFKNGAFKLAIEKQVPIVVVTYISNWKLLQNGGFFKSFGRPGIARAVIHPPIETRGMTEENLVSLRQQVYDLTANTLEEFKKYSA